MKLSDKLMLKDYIQSRDRMNPHRITEESLVVIWTKIILAVALVAICSWLAWNISGGFIENAIGGY